MILEASERQRFIQYLTAEVESGKAIITQLEKLPRMEIAIKAEKMLIAANSAVLQRLQIEDF